MGQVWDCERLWEEPEGIMRTNSELFWGRKTFWAQLEQRQGMAWPDYQECICFLVAFVALKGQGPRKDINLKLFWSVSRFHRSCSVLLRSPWVELFKSWICQEDDWWEEWCPKISSQRDLFLPFRSQKLRHVKEEGAIPQKSCYTPSLESTTVTSLCMPSPMQQPRIVIINWS